MTPPKTRPPSIGCPPVADPSDNRRAELLPWPGWQARLWVLSAVTASTVALTGWSVGTAAPSAPSAPAATGAAPSSPSTPAAKTAPAPTLSTKSAARADAKPEPKPQPKATPKTTPAGPPPPDAAELAAREVLAGAPVPEVYLFVGAKWPAIRSPAPSTWADVWTRGPTVEQAAFDADGEPVPAPDKPAGYLLTYAVRHDPVDTVPAPARLVSVVRLVKAPAADAKFPSAESLADVTGIPAPVVARQWALVSATFRDRPFAQLATDPKVADLVAGLHRSSAGATPLRPWEDAPALQRQAAVDLKRRLQGQDWRLPRIPVTPAVIDGPAARIVREGPPADAGVKPDTSAKMDAVCKEFAADTDEAFAVCIVRHGVIVHHAAYGTRDGRAMTLADKSWMASITKTMSASLMLALIDRGVVRFDDPVDKFLPALTGVHPRGRALTIRDCWTHTNGLQHFPLGDDTRHDVELRAHDVLPAAQVGKVWAYNGSGYALGGKVLEAVTGRAVPQLYREALLEPLGMDHTDVVGTHADARSVPLDIAKFGQMLLNGGAYGNRRFFRAETLREALPRRLTDLLGPDATKVFGFGIDGRPDRFGHGAASAATFSVDVARDLVIVVTRNRQGTNQGRYMGRLMKVLDDGIVAEK